MTGKRSRDAYQDCIRFVQVAQIRSWMKAAAFDGVGQRLSGQVVNVDFAVPQSLDFFFVDIEPYNLERCADQRQDQRKANVAKSDDCNSGSTVTIFCEQNLHRQMPI